MQPRRPVETVLLLEENNSFQVQFSLQSEIRISGAAWCVLSLQPSRGPNTVCDSWGEDGDLITTQKPWFWEQRQKNILDLPVRVKLKKVELSERCDGIYYFPWAQEAHRVLAGVVLTDCRREVTLLSPFSYISTKALQWQSVKDIYWTHTVGLISVTRQLTCFKWHWGRAEYYQPVRLQIPDCAGEVSSSLSVYCD